MTTNELSGQETSGCIGLKTTVCHNGVINVKRPESDRAHSVFVDGAGEVVRCSCKGHKFNGHCVHQDEIETRPLVRSSAVAAAAEIGQQIATDGGTVIETDETTDETDHDHDHPQADHWGHEVAHYSDEVEGAGEKRQCQSCGSRFEVAMIAATEDSNNQKWEEFYECQSCGATGSFRVDGEAHSRDAQRTWTGRIAYPEE
ncbi:hypothetical protein [Halococcus salifodinae]|uniref:Uncharacterized protein n=1 Tax=Halococcus salifodinae DSM 8989 TaxID=1227456 RepID=M0MQ86_9EURY|nr:hypothetical protein [Halococcus salifodinae]EMA47796.1 hypothetical protein C450_20796 [Halococcus salifodinae DSM 8989]